MCKVYTPFLFYPGSDVACTFAKNSAKSQAPSEITRAQKQRVCAHRHAHKSKEFVHTGTSCACVLTSLSGERENMVCIIALNTYQKNIVANILSKSCNSTFATNHKVNVIYSFCNLIVSCLYLYHMI